MQETGSRLEQANSHNYRVVMSWITHCVCHCLQIDLSKIARYGPGCLSISLVGSSTDGEAGASAGCTWSEGTEWISN